MLSLALSVPDRISLQNPIHDLSFHGSHPADSLQGSLFLKYRHPFLMSWLFLCGVLGWFSCDRFQTFMEAPPQMFASIVIKRSSSKKRGWQSASEETSSDTPRQQPERARHTARCAGLRDTSALHGITFHKHNRQKRGRHTKIQTSTNEGQPLKILGLLKQD